VSNQDVVNEANSSQPSWRAINVNQLYATIIQHEPRNYVAISDMKADGLLSPLSLTNFNELGTGSDQ